MSRIVLLLIILLCWAVPALAVPETVSLRVTDVSPRSFCLVWMSNVAIEPGVEVYADAGMLDELTSSLTVETFPDVSAAVVEAAEAKQVYRLRVAGLQAGQSYFVRSVGFDLADKSSIGYSALQTVTTASRIISHKSEPDGSLTGLNNDLLGFKVYVRPAQNGEAFAGLGDLLLLESADFATPVSAFAGAGIALGEGLLDLNNLFGLSGMSAVVAGGELVTLRVYRGETLSVLYHLRKLSANTGQMQVAHAQRGFNPADVNLDGIVDSADFMVFKKQFRQSADDPAFNPDFNFVAISTEEVTAADQVDLRDFSWFAGQFGKQQL